MDIASFFRPSQSTNQNNTNQGTGNQNQGNQTGNQNGNQGNGSGGAGGGPKANDNNAWNGGNNNNGNNNNQNQNNNNNGNNGTGNGNQTTQTQNEANPLDSFKGMWDNKDTQQDTAPTFSIDPKVLDSVVSQQDFMKGMDPEILKKAATGDMSAIQELIQHSARQAYRASIEHNGFLTEKFVGAREGFNEKGLSSKVREHMTGSELSDIPGYSHPVVRAQLTEIANKLQKANPDATPQQIVKMAREYFKIFSEAINPQSQEQINKGKPQETDWQGWFDKEEQSGQSA